MPLGALLPLLINKIIEVQLADNKPFQKFYNQMYSSYNPDITGYTLLFMIPPDLSADGWADNAKIDADGGGIIGGIMDFLGLAPTKIETWADLIKVYPFFATDFTPPQTQVQNAQVQSRTGAVSYASDVLETETVSVQFIESNPLAVYKFHLYWIEYIRNILRGEIKPNDKYLNPDDDQNFGAQDYLASFFVAKYILDMKEISYVGKCTGVYPLTLPSKDLIGNRLTNEITMLPIEYACIAYREWTSGLNINNYVYDELENYLNATFSGGGLFGLF